MVARVISPLPPPPPPWPPRRLLRLFWGAYLLSSVSRQSLWSPTAAALTTNHSWWYWRRRSIGFCTCSATAVHEQQWSVVGFGSGRELRRSWWWSPSCVVIASCACLEREKKRSDVTRKNVNLLLYPREANERDQPRNPLFAIIENHMEITLLTPHSTSSLALHTMWWWLLTWNDIKYRTGFSLSISLPPLLLLRM